MNTVPKSVFAWLCLVGLSAVMLVGCEDHQVPEPTAPPDIPDTRDNDRVMPELCEQPCDVDINLPEAPGQLPSVPDVIRVARGTEVNFRLGRGNPERQNTVLSFEQPAFVDEQNRPVYTLNLGAGDNLYRTTSANVCRPPDGCRYVVINVGQPQRPSIISTPYIIIE